jgi:hypothetical protein
VGIGAPQSFGPFTGRFGIKESTGGLGLDTLLFDKRFEIRQDLFGFGEVVLPRWRISLGYEFVNRVSRLAARWRGRHLEQLTSRLLRRPAVAIQRRGFEEHSAVRAQSALI